VPIAAEGAPLAAQTVLAKGACTKKKSLPHQDLWKKKNRRRGGEKKRVGSLFWRRPQESRTVVKESRSPREKEMDRCRGEGGGGDLRCKKKGVSYLGRTIDRTARSGEKVNCPCLLKGKNSAAVFTRRKEKLRECGGGKSLVVDKF